MKKLVNLVIIFCCSFYTLTCLAGKNVKFAIPDLTYNGPADDLSVGTPIGSSWGSIITEPALCHDSNFGLSRGFITAISPITSLTTVIDGVSYPVYETGTPGIGWVMGVKDTNATNYSPLRKAANQWYPAPGTSTDTVANLGGLLKITLVKTEGHLNSGQTKLLGNDIARVNCSSTLSKDTALVSLNTATITIKALGCTIMNSNSSTVSLGDFSVAKFNEVNSTQGNAVANLSLSCDNNVNVKATLSDQTDTSNRSNIIKLTSDSTATGIGVQALYQGNVVTLGADSANKGTQNQFAVVSTSSDNQAVPVDLTFRYIRTGTVKAGIANALVGVTFSYQ